MVFYFQTIYDCIPRIPDSNVATVIISLIVILFMVFMNEIMKVNDKRFGQCANVRDMRFFSNQFFDQSSSIFFINLLRYLFFRQPRCSKICKFPVPAELIAVVGGTAASHILGVGTVYGVRLVGDIPMGLPMPELPPIKLLGLVAFDSIAIAIVSYTVTISMALIFAKKQNYEVDPNQELLAMVKTKFFQIRAFEFHWNDN